MKNTLKTLLLAFALTLGANPLLAGPGGGHTHGPKQTKQVEQNDAQKVALNVLGNYVKQGKLAQSWKSAQLKEVSEVLYSGTKEWKFHFVNAQELEVSRQNLYIFVNVYGEYTGANFTGK